MGEVSKGNLVSLWGRGVGRERFDSFTRTKSFGRGLLLDKFPGFAQQAGVERRKIDASGTTLVLGWRHSTRRLLGDLSSLL